VSNTELVMLVGGAIAVIFGAIDVLQAEGRINLTTWGVIVLGVVFMILALA
jgi:hypothetical protein